MAGKKGRGPRDKGDLKEQLARVPWASRGRVTPISRLAQSIVPVGNKAGVPKGDLALHITIQDPAHESWVLDIQGTAFQAGRGKLLTCWHVIEHLRFNEREAYIWANSRLNGVEAQRPYPFAAVLKYYDLRFEDGGPGVDAGVLICPAVSTDEFPYEVPPVTWGDSTRVGVGAPHQSDRSCARWPVRSAVTASSAPSMTRSSPRSTATVASVDAPGVAVGSNRSAWATGTRTSMGDSSVPSSATTSVRTTRCRASTRVTGVRARTAST